MRCLEELIARYLPWLRDQVRLRLGPGLRAKAETADFVQDAMVEFLKYGPRFVLSDENHFRALLLTVVNNTLRNNHRWFMAARRKVSLEKPLPPTTILSLDPSAVSARTPSKSAERHEREAWVRLGMEVLEPEAREVIVLREWEGLTFPELGDRIGISSNAARKRYNQAMLKLTGAVSALRNGNYSDIF
jgi:RNA polymerase sigma-70 factor (ECF subfamily)